MTTPFSTATPATAMNPTAAGIENGKPAQRSAPRRRRPARAARRRTRRSRSAGRRTSGTASPKMMASAIGTTNPSRLLARVKFSNWPPHSSVTPSGSLTACATWCARLVDEADQIAAAHVDLDQHAALQRFAVDDRRPLASRGWSPPTPAEPAGRSTSRPAARRTPPASASPAAAAASGRSGASPRRSCRRCARRATPRPPPARGRRVMP